ncbi:hypothetical protein WUBG_07552 [Wuchereria bancrofti]|uniref:Uncharacterized protein n=1 Tax=Wuchereria bancrofti TaxID=6293 RepID=J9F2J4_WUCBA|nr:hypothetical protein WUBG_07552 [Wuchereria bancrofti]
MATTIGKGSGWVKGQSARLAFIDDTGNKGGNKDLLNGSPENSSMVHVEKDDRNCILQVGKRMFDAKCNVERRL